MGGPDGLSGAVRRDWGEAGILAAVLKAAQYLAALRAGQDVWAEVGASLLGFFSADLVAVGRRVDGAALDVRCWEAAGVGASAVRPCALDAGGRAAMDEVLESGFLVTRALGPSRSLAAAFLPVSGDHRAEAVLMVAHAAGMPRELLDVYLAVAGLAGTTMARLAAEQELRDRRLELEQLVRDRTAQLERANGRLQLEIAERRLAEDMAREMAYHDSLTGLPNRRLFADRLEVAIARARRDGHRIAVAVLDLDRFKSVNDGRGHSLGDALLQAVAGRLVGGLREQDTVARIGGDEFVAVLADLADPAHAAALAEKLIALVRDPFMLDGGPVHMTASVGVAVYPEHGAGEDVLLRHADEAMYRAKEQGRDAYRLWAAPDASAPEGVH